MMKNSLPLCCVRILSEELLSVACVLLLSVVYLLNLDFESISDKLLSVILLLSGVHVTFCCIIGLN